MRNGHGPYCQVTCINTFGSYRCTCDGLPGTRLTANGQCEDLGDCGFNNGGCSQKCITTNGRRFCLCENGYYLGGDLKTCKGRNACIHTFCKIIELIHFGV